MNTICKGYSFQFDIRYCPAKSDPPSVTKITLRGNTLNHERVEIPRNGKGTKVIRLKGEYIGHDGELFQRIEPGYADMLIVHRGFQFAIWWGDPEEVGRQSSWIAGFLAHDPLSALHAIPKLERQLKFMQGLKHSRSEEEEALTDLLEQLRKDLIPGTSVTS